jgi:hypothetical protein
MSKGRSQQEGMAKYPSDLGESWFNGPKEIQNDWVIIDQELTFVGDEDAKEGVGNEADTVLLLLKNKKGDKDEKKKSEKLGKNPPPKASTWTAANFKDMAASWIQKAIGSRGIDKVLSAEDATYRKVW